MDKIQLLESLEIVIKENYEQPNVTVHELKVELSFLQDTGSASGFGDGGGW